MPRVPAESRAPTAGKWLFAVVVPGSALALGSLPLGALLVMSILAALSCGLLWMDSNARVSSATRWVLVGGLIFLGVTVLQVIPLPAAFVRMLSSANADIWARALAPLHEPGPAWPTLSIAPSATRVEVLRGFFYGCVFLAALRVTMLDRGERFLERVVVFSTTLVALSALAHTAVDAEKVFGVYRPHERYAYQAGRLGPLLNTNHLAAYLNMGALVALGALLARRSMPRALSGSAALVLAATSVWQSSRGATASVIFGIILTFALTFYAKRRSGSARAEVAIFAACAVAATIIVTIALSKASGHLLSQDFSKVDVARSSLELVAASPWFGVGRGGFESVFSAVRDGTIYVTWTNPEDFVIQWLVEWGVPTSVGGAALLAWALRPQIVIRAAGSAIGAWVALVASILHELVDYHFEIPGIVVVAAVCMALVVGGRSRPHGSAQPNTSSSPRLAAFALAGGTFVAAALAWGELGHSLAEDRRALSDMAVDKSLTPERFHDEIRASMLRYPAEPFFPLMGAVRVQVNDEGSVIPWTARALERNPRFGRAHFVLARSLAPAHPAQARLEYRLAYVNDRGLRDSIVKEAVRLVDGETSALELVSEGAAGADVLDALITALQPRLPSTAVALDRELEVRAPTSTAPLRRRAEAAASDAMGGAPWCPRESACMNDAVAVSEELARREPTKCVSHALVAQVRIARGDVLGALDRLEHAMDGLVDRPACQRQYIKLALDNRQPRRGEVALDLLVRGGCGGSDDCVSLYRWAAGIEESRGHYVRAVQLYRLLIPLTPDPDEILEHIGGMGERDGVVVDALDAYSTLANRHPDDPRWPHRIRELRARARPLPGPLPSP